ncbi:hypothetical protein HanIR_Chr03g0121181 [Helianthus annuus]|nr:hypothetical protein HanIR_Chr03g0121181 [Helianthus annuus]
MIHPFFTHICILFRIHCSYLIYIFITSLSSRVIHGWLIRKITILIYKFKLIKTK